MALISIMAVQTDVFRVHRNVFRTGYGRFGVFSDGGSSGRSKAVCQRDFKKDGGLEHET